MTIDDIMAMADRCYSRFDAEPQWKLRAAIEQAIAHERERCAKVCEKIEDEAQADWKGKSGKRPCYDPNDQGISDGACACAAAIRKGTT